MRKSCKWFLMACLVLAVCLVMPCGKVQAEPKAYELILPEADTRLYTEEELEGMTAQVASYARNEIYARHGRKFRSAELTAWFSEQPWYLGTIEPGDFSDNMLNAYESGNVGLLLKLEKARTEDGSGYHLDEEGYTFDEVYAYLSQGFEEEGYNILEGLEVYATAATVFMDAAHFYMMLPSNLNWSYNQTAADSFEIFYKPARDTGFGGWVVSITAYDLDDPEYEELPHYAVCGISSDKRYVASYPTDVQFNGNDPTQTEEYGKLMEWAYTLDIKDPENICPFEVVDEEAEVMPVKIDTRAE